MMNLLKVIKKQLNDYLQIIRNHNDKVFIPEEEITKQKLLKRTTDYNPVNRIKYTSRSGIIRGLPDPVKNK